MFTTYPKNIETFSTYPKDLEIFTTYPKDIENTSISTKILDIISNSHFENNSPSSSTSLNRNNFFYDEKTNKTIFLESNENCPEQFFYENKNSKECTKSCDISEIINKDCSINHLTLNNIEDITKDMRNIINNTKIDQETNIVIEGDNVVYQIISSEKMYENKNKNISIIDLGDCGEKLKEHYKIKELLIFKMDLKLNDNSPNILNYEVYNPLTLSKLNLSICEGIKITVYSPYTPSQESLNKLLKLNESGYDLYNPNDSFYQDICTPFTSDNGTDILLSDRQADFFENISLCEYGCIYKGYDYNYEKAKCECNVKEEIEVNETKITEKTFFSSFGLDRFSNIKVLKCFKLVFSKLGQKNNKGSYIFIVDITLFIILSFSFHFRQKQIIAKNFRKVIETKFKINGKEMHLFPPKKRRKKRKNKISKLIYNKNYQNKETQKEKLIEKNIIIHDEKNLNNPKINNLYEKNIFNKNINKKNSLKVLSGLNSINKYFISVNNNITIKSLSSNKDINSLGKEKNKNYLIDKNNNKYNYNDEELNLLNYQEAIIYDKRTYFQYYFDLVKRKQIILFTFMLNNDYNIFDIKLALLLFSFALYFAVSALFFEDETMHKIYENKGKLNILFQIPHILYSTLISSIINILVKFLALSNKDMIRIKQIKDKENALRESAKLLNRLKIKFNLFYIVSFIFLLFFWYFISAFCSVYKNTQKILIENTFSSFGLSLLYPFGLNLFPGFLRIPALRASNKNLECLYKISKIITLI